VQQQVSVGREDLENEEYVDVMNQDEEDLEMDDQDGEEQIVDMDIVPNSKPPIVPEEGTYLTALNEAGVDPQRIEQLKQSKSVSW